MKANSYDKLYVTDKVSVVISNDIIKKIEGKRQIFLRIF